MLSLDEKNAGQQIDLGLGEEAQLALPEKRLSGYHWQIEQGGQPVLALQDDDATAPGSAPGATHVRRLRIRAVQPGTATVSLRHRRSWEPANSGRTFSLIFHVAA